jgi:type IV pilus assembly protein PilV
MNLRPFPPFLRHSRGFTMVEALVALVVLAIGLLGIAALYLDSLRAGRTAIYRTQAVNLAADLADRLRANRTAILGYEADFALVIDPATLPACSEVAPCADADLALRDLGLWKAAVAQQLPGGEGQVEVTAPAVADDPAAYVITVRWTEVGQDVPAQYQLRAET